MLGQLLVRTSLSGAANRLQQRATRGGMAVSFKARTRKADRRNLFGSILDGTCHSRTVSHPAQLGLIFISTPPAQSDMLCEERQHTLMVVACDFDAAGCTDCSLVSSSWAMPRLRLGQDNNSEIWCWTVTIDSYEIRGNTLEATPVRPWLHTDELYLDLQPLRF
jgi:hypothetical protein